MVPSWFRWTLVVGLGVAIGFVIAAALTLLVAAQVTGDATWAAATPIWAVAVLGGLIQGAIVGLLQFALLRSWLPDLNGRLWVLATAVISAVGWAVGIGISLASIINSENEVVTVAELDAGNGLNWMAAIVGIVAGAVLGALFGLVQGHLLRGRVPYAKVWIPANVIAWAAGIAFLSVGLSTPEDGWPLEATIVLAVFTFVLTGLVVALVTGRALHYLVDEPTPETAG